MKFLLSTIVLVCLLLFAFVDESNAQISSQKITKNVEGYQFTILGNLDTISTATTNYDSLWTKELELTGHDDAEIFTYLSKFTPTAGNPKYSVEWFASRDNITYFLVDTVIHQSTNNGRVWDSYKLQNNTAQKLRFPYNKLLILGILAGRDNAAFEFTLYSSAADATYKPTTITGR